MSIVEKMARAIYASEGKCYTDDARMFKPFPWEELDDDDYQCVREGYRDKARAVLTATGLTEAQLEGLANGTMVIVYADKNLR